MRQPPSTVSCRKFNPFRETIIAFADQFCPPPYDCHIFFTKHIRSSPVPSFLATAQGVIPKITQRASVVRSKRQLIVSYRANRSAYCPSEAAHTARCFHCVQNDNNAHTIAWHYPSNHSPSPFCLK